jgi:hypothetical protein
VRFAHTAPPLALSILGVFVEPHLDVLYNLLGRFRAVPELDPDEGPGPDRPAMDHVEILLVQIGVLGWGRRLPLEEVQLVRAEVAEISLAIVGSIHFHAKAATFGGFGASGEVIPRQRICRDGISTA